MKTSKNVIKTKVLFLNFMLLSCSLSHLISSRKCQYCSKNFWTLIFCCNNGSTSASNPKAAISFSCASRITRLFFIYIYLYIYFVWMYAGQLQHWEVRWITVITWTHLNTAVDQQCWAITPWIFKKWFRFFWGIKMIFLANTKCAKCFCK